MDWEPVCAEAPGETSGLTELSGITELFGLRDGETVAAAATDSSAPRSSFEDSASDAFVRWIVTTTGSLDPADASSGRMVHGRYRLIAQLGAGGMGVTYRSWDTQAGVPVVVKMPKGEVRRDQELMARFTREIESMRAVLHESIVPITDSGDDDGCPFVVMRFLPGGALSDYRRRDGNGNPIKNPPGMLHFWLPGVAAALEHIHSKGMLHRDVKPGNIFLDGFLKPYLGDFGIAKVVDESGGLAKEQTLTATKMAVGTPEYMAPELFRPKSAPDGRVDQYALAVTVYEMLCGDKPFTGRAAHIIVEHSSLPVPSLEKRCPGLQQNVYEAVHRGLAKAPQERFPSCGEFAAAVLAELPRLAAEADTVRLLCPACKNILRLPQAAAGKSGRCPRCRSAIDVAANLGSLWLESEELGGGPAAPTAAAVTVTEPQGVSARSGRPSARAPSRSWSRDWVAAAAFVGLATGLLIGLGIPRSPQYVTSSSVHDARMVTQAQPVAVSLSFFSSPSSLRWDWSHSIGYASDPNVSRLVHGILFLMMLLMLAAPVFLLTAVAFFRRIPRPLFRAFPEGTGIGPFTWDRLYSYTWKPDHLELVMLDPKIRANLEAGRSPIPGAHVIRGVVPLHQRETVETFLAEKLAEANAAAKAARGRTPRALADS